MLAIPSKKARQRPATYLEADDVRAIIAKPDRRTIDADLHKRRIELHHHFVPLSVRHGPLAAQLKSAISLVQQQTKMTVHKFDLAKRKFEKVLDNVGQFVVSHDGEKMLYRLGPDKWFLTGTSAPPANATV